MVGPGPATRGRDRLVVLAGLALLALLGAALLWPPAPPSGSGPPPGVEATTLREGIVGRATSINPLEVRNGADADLVPLVFSGLTRSLPGGSVGPDLAESWTIAADGKTYTFRIRSGATWQDGHPVTADDVVFTVLSIQEPSYEGPLRSSWQAVHVAKLDPRTVRFTLDDPLGAFLEATTLPLLPAHLLVGLQAGSTQDVLFNRQPVGSGPYRLVRLEADQAVLELAGDGASATPTELPGYWPLGGSAGPISRIVVSFYPDVDSLSAAYEAGELDTAAGLPPERALALAGTPGTTVLRYPTTTLTAVVLNVRPGHSLFRDPNVRRGLLRAIDRDGLVSGFLRGAAARADSPISPASWAFDASNSTVYRFDTKAAAENLQAAGWKRGAQGWVGKDGQPITFALSTIDAVDDPVGRVLAAAIVADWRSVGLDVRLDENDTDGFVGGLVSGDFEAAILDVNLGLDPDVFPLFASSQALEGGSNVGGYQSAGLDRLLKAARLGVGRAARAQAFAALQAVLTRDVPILPIVFADELYVVRDTIQEPGTRLLADRSGRFWDVLTWRLADGRAAESAVAR